jgi:outer membrane protein assembly factor BamB
MHLYNELHRAFTPSPAPLTSDVLWFNATGYITYSSPAIADGMVFIGATDFTGSYMYAFYQSNGTRAWRTQTWAPVAGGEGFSSSPAYSNGYVVFGGDRIYCLYANNGTVKWTVEPGNMNWGDGTPTIAEGKVFIGGSDRRVYNIDLDTGTVLWTFQTLGPPTGGSNWGLYAAPAIYNGHAYAAACDGYVYQIKIDQPGPTAVANHSFNTGYAMYGSPVIFDGKVYIGNGYTFNRLANRFYALDATDLSVVWEFYPGAATSFLSSAAIAYDKVYIGSVDGNLYVLDPWGDGLGGTWVIWEYPIGSTWSSPAIAAGQVFIGSRSNFLYAFDADQPGLPDYNWRYNTNGDVDSSPAVSDGRVYVGTHGGGGRIYCFGQPGDFTPPRALSVSPTGTGVPIDTNFVVQWSETMDWDSVNMSFSFTDGFTIWTSSDGVLTHNPPTSTSTFDPFFDLSYSTTYWVTFTALAMDLAGNPLDGNGDGTGGDDLVWSFTTGAEPPPTIEVWEPGGTLGQTYQVGTLLPITWNAYDNDPWPSGGNVVNISYGPGMTGGTPIAQLEFEDGIYVWDTALVPTGLYYVNISVYDSVGQTSSGNGNFTFEISSIPNRPPDVSTSSPSGGESWTGGSVIDVIWGMKDDYTQQQNLVVYLNYSYAGGPGTIAGPLTGLTEPFSYPWTLPFIDGVDVVVNVDVVDEGGELGTNTTNEFEIDSTPPFILNTNPTDGQLNVATNTNIIATWSEGMNVTATNPSFSLEDAVTGAPVAGTFWWSGANSSMTFDPLIDLQPNTVYIANFTTSAKDDSYPGNNIPALYSWNFTTAMAPDTTPPEIWDVQTVPFPQDVYLPVNISARIVDTFGVAEARVKIDDPVGSPIGNFSMSFDSFTSRYYFVRSYDALGSYFCTVVARDTSGNWNSTACVLAIWDMTPPSISNVTKVPDPQEVFGTVNISAVVEDNYWLIDVFVDIPGVGSSIMSFDSGSGRYYYERQYDILGSYMFWIFANDSTFNQASYSGMFNITDSTPPTISVVTAIPDPQEVLGSVNVSAVVEDIYQLLDVFVDIPGVGSSSMSFDSGSGRYYYERQYDVLGVYTFWIFANDTSLNQASSSGGFNIIDSTLPLISGLTDIPDPQEIDGFVNVSAAVTDNYALTSVNVDIQSVGNLSMSFDSSTGRYYHNQSYDTLGQYALTIWASDSSSNWNKLSGEFDIVDTTPPQIVHTPPPDVAVGSSINVQAIVTDNHQVNSVWLNYTDASGNHFNASMTYVTGDSYQLTIPTQNQAGDVVYHIYARDESGNGASTQVHRVSVIAVVDDSVPRPPTNLRAQTSSGDNRVDLTWDEPTLNVDGTPLDDLEGYNLYRWDADTGEEAMFSLSSENTAFIDVTGQLGKTYYYVVTAVDESGNESDYSNSVTVALAVEGDDFLIWGIILAIVIGALAAVLALFLILGRRKKKKEAPEGSTEGETVGEGLDEQEKSE